MCVVWCGWMEGSLTIVDVYKCVCVRCNVDRQIDDGVRTNPPRLCGAVLRFNFDVVLVSGTINIVGLCVPRTGDVARAYDSHALGELVELKEPVRVDAVLNVD